MKKDGWIDTLAILFACKMEMIASTTTGIACDTNNDTGKHPFTFTNYDRG